MKVINFSEQNSVINHFMAEIRDKNYQKNRLLFRNNIQRIGEMMAYEISKTLNYKPKTVTTPLGTLDIPVIKDEVLLATVLRAGLPFHEGFLHVFDHAENGFVSAFRMYTNRDPMLATGGSMVAAYEALLKTGKPHQVHIASVIGTPEGVEMLQKSVAEDVTLWCAAIDPGMNEHKYIVPGFGDCGDLCYGEKL